MEIVSANLLFIFLINAAYIFVKRRKGKKKITIELENFYASTTNLTYDDCIILLVLIG